MARIEIVSETPITMAEAKHEIEKIKKRDTELNFRSLKTDEYLGSFTKLDKKTSDEIYKKIDELQLPRMKREHIIKIIDLMPEDVEELKVVLQGYTLTLSSENLKKIADIIAPYLGNKKKKDETEEKAEE